MPSQLNYTRSGEGEAMILIHGIGSELCVWEPVLPTLSRQFDVIALDLPGFGDSPALPDALVPSPVGLARAVAGLLDELDIAQAHVVGNSLGGWIALELGVLGRARSVTALCPAGLWRRPLATAGAPQVRGRAQQAARRLRPVIPLLMRSGTLRRVALSAFVAHPERVPYHAATRMLRSYARAAAYDATNTAMRQSYFHGAASLSVPVTLAFGERDPLIRPVELPVAGSRSIILPDCGHIPMWDDPDLVAQAILETAQARMDELPATGTG